MVSLSSSDSFSSLLTDKSLDGLTSDFKSSSLGITKAVEDWVRVGGFFDGWDSEELLLNVRDGDEVLNDEWDILLNEVLLKFPEGELLDGSYFVRHEDLGSVALEELGNVWLIDGDLEWNLLPLSLFEFTLNGVWLLLVLSNSDLAGDDVWNLLDDGVVDSLSALIWDRDFLLKWDLVVDGVWDLLRDNIWDLVGDSVWHLSGGCVWDFNLDFKWDLSLNSVWDVSLNLNWLEGLDLILFGDILGLGNLVWNLFNGHNWDLLGNLVLFGNVLSHGVDVSVIRGVSSTVRSGGLSPLPSEASEAESTAKATSSS